MIANGRQYRISRNWLERFEQARAGVEEPDDTLDPRARQAFRDQYDSQIEELRTELAEYEALRRNEVDVLEVDSLSKLPEALIRARAAAGLSQEALGERLGLKKQQIQRWEATRYAGVDLERLQAIADAIGAQVSERVVLPVATSKKEPVGAPVSLAGALKRAGLTTDDIASRLHLPGGVMRALQRGRVDLNTVPERLVAQLSKQLGINQMETRRLIARRNSGGHVAQPPASAHAEGDTSAGGTNTPMQADPRRLPSFQETVTSAPDLTDEHRQAWMGE